MPKPKSDTLFGGEEPWDPTLWTASDDRVRGGTSTSYLTPSPSRSTALFHGHLDTHTLGGAGFASQRTTTTSPWDLSPYTGILLTLGKSDSKTYTFILKDEVLPVNAENGREQATVSWEYDFEVGKEQVEAGSAFVYIPWGSFNPTYRGREKEDAGELDVKSIKRFSIMMRSFFAKQEGDFELEIKSIEAVSRPGDLERGEDVKVRGWRSVFRAPVLMALLAVTALAYGVCTYVCPWVKHTRNMRHWEK